MLEKKICIRSNSICLLIQFPVNSITVWSVCVKGFSFWRSGRAPFQYWQMDSMDPRSKLRSDSSTCCCCSGRRSRRGKADIARQQKGPGKVRGAGGKGGKALGQFIANGKRRQRSM